MGNGTGACPIRWLSRYKEFALTARTGTKQGLGGADTAIHAYPLPALPPCGTRGPRGAGHTPHAGEWQGHPRAPCLLRPLPCQAEQLSCTGARCMVLPTAPREAVTRWHKGSFSHSWWAGPREALQPPGWATAPGAAWPCAWAPHLCTVEGWGKREGEQDA